MERVSLYIMIERRKAGIAGLVGLTLAVSPFIGDIGSRFVYNTLSPSQDPGSQLVLVAADCNVADYNPKTEMETLHCQRYFRVNGLSVKFGPEFTEKFWNCRGHVPVSFYYEVL